MNCPTCGQPTVKPAVKAAEPKMATCPYGHHVKVTDGRFVMHG